MSEQLVIRLGSDVSAKIHWLVWSEAEQEIIGSGELAGSALLSDLTESATQRDVVVLVPCGSVGIHQLDVPAGARRQMVNALPFLLEDKLAENIESLHIVPIGHDKETVTVAVVNHGLMEQWRDWLEQAQIKAYRWMPDALALPVPEALQANALQLDDLWLFRIGLFHGVSIDASWLNLALPKLGADCSVEQINHYTDAPEDNASSLPPFWVAASALLPMELLARGAIKSPINLLQGPYRRQAEWTKLWAVWRKAAIAVAVLFCLGVVNLLIEGQSLRHDLELSQEQLRQVYKQVFPDVIRIRDSRIRRDFNQAIASIDNPHTATGLLAMLQALAPAFDEIQGLKLNNLRFDQKRNEIIIQASGNDFQTFEKFSQLAAPLQVEQGALSKKTDGVTGTLTVRNPS